MLARASCRVRSRTTGNGSAVCRALMAKRREFGITGQIHGAMRLSRTSFAVIVALDLSCGRNLKSCSECSDWNRSSICCRSCFKAVFVSSLMVRSWKSTACRVSSCTDCITMAVEEGCSTQATQLSQSNSSNGRIVPHHSSRSRSALRIVIYLVRRAHG